MYLYNSKRVVTNNVNQRYAWKKALANFTKVKKIKAISWQPNE